MNTNLENTVALKNVGRLITMHWQWIHAWKLSLVSIYKVTCNKNFSFRRLQRWSRNRGAGIDSCRSLHFKLEQKPVKVTISTQNKRKIWCQR